MLVDQACRENLVILARGYAKAAGLSLATVGRIFYGNQSFFRRLEVGNGDFTTRNYDRVVSKFREEWPRGTPWPRLRSGTRRIHKKNGG